VDQTNFLVRGHAHAQIRRAHRLKWTSDSSLSYRSLSPIQLLTDISPLAKHWASTLQILERTATSFSEFKPWWRTPILSLRIPMSRLELIQRQIHSIVSRFSSHAAQLTWSKLLVYYRLFTNDIGIPSKQPVFVDNLHLGRVSRNSIAPPRAVLQFKRRLCGVEGIINFAGSTLYPSASNQFPMDDGDRILDALGSSMDDPVEVVVVLYYPDSPRDQKPYQRPQYSTRSISIILLVEISWFYFSLLLPLHGRWNR